MSSKVSVRAQWLPYFSLETLEQFRLLEVVIKAIIILNLMDGLFTLIWVHTGMAEEANILLRDLVSNHTVVFVMVKFALVSLGSLLLWKHRRCPLSVAGLFFVFLAYYLTFLYHLQFSSQLFIQNVVF
jgi:hypothetical protein